MADIWGVFRGADLGSFYDISQLTMFADYRVPQLLRHVNIIEYSPQLAAKSLFSHISLCAYLTFIHIVDSKEEIASGSEEEIEIRAATVQAVALMQQCDECVSAHLMPVELDWMLWSHGEKMNSEGTLKPHHRTRTIFYWAPVRVCVCVWDTNTVEF